MAPDQRGRGVVYTEEGRVKWRGKRCKSFVSGVDVQKLANCDASLNILSVITFGADLTKDASPSLALRQP